MMMNSNHIVPAFYFRVLFTGFEGFNEADSSFESVSGILGIATPFNTVVAGVGENNNLPVFQPLVLRRAVTIPQHSFLRRWIINALNNQSSRLLAGAQIEILNEEHSPLITVALRELSLISWGIDELHAQKSSLLMEEISFSYKSIEIK